MGVNLLPDWEFSPHFLGFVAKRVIEMNQNHSRWCGRK